MAQLLEPRPADGTQQPDRVPTGGLPQVGVDGPEDVLRLRVPGPPQVAREVAEGGQGGGEDRTDGEPTDCAHLTTVALFYGTIQQSA